MEPMTRAALVQQLSALIQSVQGLAPGAALERLRLASEIMELRGLLGVATDPSAALAQLGDTEVITATDPKEARAQGRLWFQQHLQGRALVSPIGPVKVSGATWEKIRHGATQDLLKLRLLPAVPVVLERGKYHGRSEPYKDAGRFVAFHFFSGIVALPGYVVEMGVNVGEEKSGALVYSLNHDMHESWHKRNIPTAYPKFQTREDGDAGASEPTLDAIVADGSEFINVVILRVISKT